MFLGYGYPDELDGRKEKTMSDKVIRRTASKTKKKWLLATIGATIYDLDYEIMEKFYDATFFLLPKEEHHGKKVWEATADGVTIRVTQVTWWWQDWVAEVV